MPDTDEVTERIEVASGHVRHLWTSKNHASYRGQLHDEQTDAQKRCTAALQDVLSGLEDGARVRVIVEVLPGTCPLAEERWELIYTDQRAHNYGPASARAPLEELCELLEITAPSKWRSSSQSYGFRRWKCGFWLFSAPGMGDLLFANPDPEEVPKMRVTLSERLVVTPGIEEIQHWWFALPLALEAVRACRKAGIPV